MSSICPTSTKPHDPVRPEAAAREGSIPAQREYVMSESRLNAAGQSRQPVPIRSVMAVRDEPVVAIEDLSFTYPSGTKALEAVNIGFRKGSITGIVGPSG